MKIKKLKKIIIFLIELILVIAWINITSADIVNPWVDCFNSCNSSYNTCFNKCHYVNYNSINTFPKLAFLVIISIILFILINKRKNDK